MDKQAKLKVGLAQMAPVWLRREATLDKMVDLVGQAGEAGCALIVFGEAILPGYPFWLAHTGGARFDDAVQKAWFAHYAREAVSLKRGDLDPLCAAAAKHRLAIVTGLVERSGHTLYCALAYIAPEGSILNLHRKLVPTYEERLVWGRGDGHGLRTVPLGSFQLGALNCWENWMPLARAALYGMEEDLHLALWPGNRRNTAGVTPFVAREGRSYALSVSGLMRREDIDPDLPGGAAFREAAPDWLADGGSAVAAPNGSWLLEPVCHQEGLFPVELDPELVLSERQNFDPAGHYSRPDVMRLQLRRQRQHGLDLDDG